MSIERMNFMARYGSKEYTESVMNGDDSHAIISALEHSPHITVAHLGKAAESNNEFIRMWAADHKLTTKSIATKLAKDPDIDVRNYAENCLLRNGWKKL